MAGGAKVPFKNPLIRWVDERLPIFTLMSKEYGTFPTPRNFNYLWNFGAIATIILVVMIATGVALSMNYKPSATEAFASVERIMRDVNGGWLLRYIHANGASMFFLAVYIHIFRGLYYGSYKKPRELLWMIGVTILLVMIATAFLGYTLPWGQMSFWGATVITSLFDFIEPVQRLLVGGFAIDDQTLNRFYTLHFLLPFVIFALVAMHVWALHITGSNNPLGIDPKGPQDTLPFHPYYTIKDSVGLLVFAMIFAGFVFFAPNYLGHTDNYIPANPLVTPAHIVPEWYLLPFYAILRSIPDKFLGVVGMGGAILVLYLLPFLDTSPVRSARFRPMYKIAFWLFVVSAIVLGIIGAMPAEEPYVTIGRLATFVYFGFFVAVAVIARIEKPLPLPPSIATPVLRQPEAGAGAGPGPFATPAPAHAPQDR